MIGLDILEAVVRELGLQDWDRDGLAEAVERIKLARRQLHDLEVQATDILKVAV